jgi:LacI family transcriptional regulator
MNDAKRRKRSPRFIDIAEEAGVSHTTVNRVLNERGSVSAETRARVVAAAKRLGIPRQLPETRRGLTRFDVILAGSSTPYFHRLNLAFQRAMQMLDRKVVIHRTFIPEDDDDGIAHAMLSPRQKRQGLIVAVHDTEKVRQALRQVIKSGVPVVTLMSDIVDVPRVHYAGIDNYRAGRTAGYFLGRFAQRSGRILLLSNSLGYQAHADRLGGLGDVIAESFPALQCTSVNECHDEPDQCYAAVTQALRQHDDLVGIYNSGAGSAGIVAALRKSGVAGKIMLAGHEISDEHRQYIEQGIMDLVIDQDPDGQTVSGLQHLLYACGMIEDVPSPEPNEFRLFCRENISQRAYLPSSEPE